MEVKNAMLNFAENLVFEKKDGNSDDSTNNSAEPVDESVVSETLDTSKDYMENSVEYDSTENYITKETDDAGNTTEYSYAKRVFVIKDTRNSVRASINKLKIGDLLYMDDDGDGVPNHAVIISSINRKKKKIYYAAHTNPHKKKDLEEYLKHRKHSKKKVLAIHIIDSF